MRWSARARHLKPPPSAQCTSHALPRCIFVTIACPYALCNTLGSYVKLLQSSAAQVHARAAPRPPPACCTCVRDSARQGFAPAQLVLGSSLYDGIGIAEVDAAAAVKGRALLLARR